MAQVSKGKKNKDGSISFKIRVSKGYSKGKQRKVSTTWTSPAGMSKRQAEKNAQLEAIKFEDSIIKRTVEVDGNIRFKAFAEKFIEEYAKKKLKIKTWTVYEDKLEVINEKIGHIKLKDLRVGHLNAFYNELQGENANRRTGGLLSPKTVHGYHRVISTILTKAVKWEYIPVNIAVNAELPRVENKEAPYLDEADARRLLELLHDEPMQWRAPITFALLSGLRRGELLGLRWEDVNFQEETISIVQTSQYIPGQGVFIGTPKNKTSSRPLKLSSTAFMLLREFRIWQDKQRAYCGSYWKDTDGRIFTASDGAPLHPDNLTGWFAKFIKGTDLPHISVHSLRHSYASLLIAEGVPLVTVSKRLGHAQVSTTADIYSHSIKSADEKAAQVTEKFADVITQGVKAPRLRLVK